MQINIEVFWDAASVQLRDGPFVTDLGYFSDEVAGLSAALECLLLRSAILPERRRLGPVDISLEYRQSKCNHPPEVFHRATRSRPSPFGRRVVLRPWGGQHSWVTA